jgi:hypothetical protein
MDQYCNAGGESGWRERVVRAGGVVTFELPKQESGRQSVWNELTFG